MKEKNEKKIKNCDEISKLIKAFPKDIAALDKRSVLAKEKEDKSYISGQLFIMKSHSSLRRIIHAWTGFEGDVVIKRNISS